MAYGLVLGVYGVFRLRGIEPPPPPLDAALWIYALVFPVIAIILGVDRILARRRTGARPRSGDAVVAVLAALVATAPATGAIMLLATL